MDLTPYYGFADDAIHFHRACRDALRRSAPTCTRKYKRWCDEYFYLKHRKEPRGVGGIFFDDLADGGFDRCFALTKSVGDHFLDAYVADRSSGARTRRTASASATSRRIAAAATSSSTWSGIAGRCSGCSRTGAPRRS